MKKSAPRKPGTGYHQQLEWRQRHRRRRSFHLAQIIGLGVILGAVSGSFVSDQLLTTRGPVELADLWDQYKSSSKGERQRTQPPEQWKQHYRRAPESGVTTHEPPPITRERQQTTDVNQFDICSTPVRVNCVVDGDTIWYRGKKIRIADIDTPEIFSPKCDDEEALGQRAKRRLRDLLNEGPFQLVSNGVADTDRFGRKLRVIERNGQSLGLILVAEGLARRWDGARRSWC